MRQRLYAHLVWTTRDRRPLIDARVARFLCRFLRAVARQESAEVLEIGLVADHVHALVRLDPGTALPRLLQRWKGGSAMLATREGHAPRGAPLRGNKGYAAQRVSPAALPAVRAYLRSQPRHHPTVAISGWEGDTPEFDSRGSDEWRAADRTRLLARHSASVH